MKSVWDLRALFKRKKHIESTGRVIDMTKTRWGHNFEIMHWWSDPKDSFRAAVWVPIAPNEGDTLRWRTVYGICEAMITEVESCRDPWDMYFVNATIVNREFEGDNE